MLINRLGWRGLLVGLVIGLATGGTFAWASIPNSTTGAVNACYPTSGTSKGALRVIDYQAGARCASGEALLSWSSRGVRWRGPWNGTVAYSVNDVVRYSGSAYIARLANTNVVPTNMTNWALMVSVGSTGSQGATGTQGLQGNTGGTGAQGPSGAQGSTGAQGATGLQGADGLSSTSNFASTGNGPTDPAWGGTALTLGCNGCYNPVSQISLSVPSGGEHNILVMGWFSVTCSQCSSVDVYAMLGTDGVVAATGPARSTMYQGGQAETLQLSMVIKRGPGTHSFETVAWAQWGAGVATVKVLGRGMQAIDLGPDDG